jgi:hypothetical protein
VTEEGHRRRSEQETTGKAFVVTAFALGNGGHDPANPSLRLSPDPLLTELPEVVFGPKATSSFDFANSRCPTWDCTLGYDEGVTKFSSVGLYAQVVYSPVEDDPELNTLFLFAVVNFAQRSKTDGTVLTLRIGVQR